ncbi:MAG: 16S rRNA (cytidine(1402)-2'-O)-methyltransferase [Chloroflexi bacterium]|nr:16S rRNA (cytidine(1402)-2'-O)-methyltransferase [Chloroflexota bacterium]
MGTLFVVATPIGNLEDLTFRASRVLRSVDVVVAEDVQRARKLLGHVGSTPKVITYREDSPESREDAIIERLRAGDVALIVDAGTPGVSDPGPDLLARVRVEGLPVVPIPGPSALTTALSVVSFARQPVAFLAFLPERRLRRERLVRRAADTARTLVIYLSPHGVADRLSELETWLGDVPAALCRELTKLHEEIRESTLADIANHVSVVGARGELTVVIDVGGVAEAPQVDQATVEEQLRIHLDAGTRPAKAAGAVARALNLPREDVYRIARMLRESPHGSA